MTTIRNDSTALHDSDLSTHEHIAAHPEPSTDARGSTNEVLRFEPLLITGSTELSQQTPPPSLPSVNLGPGSSGDDVTALQNALTQLGLLDASHAKQGRYDAATTEAVKSLQRSLGVKDDGIVGPKTRWAFDGLNHPGTSEPIAQAAVGLEPGSRGPAVERLQRALVDAGFLDPNEVAKAPGLFGPRTTAALQQARQQPGATMDAINAELGQGNGQRALDLIQGAFALSGEKEFEGGRKLTDQERARMYMAEAHGYLLVGKPDEARISMEKLDAHDKQYQCPPETSPKLSQLLDDVRLGFALRRAQLHR